MNARIPALMCLSVAAFALGGCGENPAANVAPAVTSAPKPVDSTPAPTPAASPTPAPAPAEKSATPTPATATAAAPTEKSAAPAPAGALTISGDSGSKIEFIGSKVGGSHNGGFKTWTGTVELTGDKTAVAKVNVDIDTTSLWSDDEKLTGHLKNADFFEVDKYPKSTFVSTEIKTGGEKGATHTLVGNFTLHGTTKSISIPATIKVADGAASIVSEFSFKRSDFGMPTGLKLSVVRDEVVVKVDAKTAKKG